MLNQFHQPFLTFAWKRQFTRHHFKKNNPNRPNIRQLTGIIPILQYFWRHIQRRTCTRSIIILIFCVMLNLIRKSKIPNLDTLLGNENVRRFDITMNNFMLENCLKSLDDVQNVGNCFCLNELAFFYYFAYQVTVLAKLSHNVNAILLIELRLDLYNVRVWFEFPLNLEFIRKHHFLLLII